MKIQEFSFRNICSYGNKLQTFTFGDEPKLVMIQGQNGSGKSSISDALTVSIYGRSAIRPTGSIPNRINKNAYTQVKFLTSKGRVVEIERGIDPNFSKLLIDGTEHNLPDKRRVDAFIEDELTRIPFNVFANTISLSINDFKSFVKLSPHDKRQIIDKIFGLDLINDMSEVSKKETRSIRQKMVTLESTLNSNKKLLESSILQLEQLKNQSITDNAERIIELEKELAKLELAKIDTKQRAQDFNESIDELSNKISEFRNKQSSISLTISEIQKKLDIYSKNKCPHCLSDLTDAIHTEIKDRLTNKKVDLQLELPDLAKVIQTTDLELRRVKGDQSIQSNSYYQISGQIDPIKRNIESLKKQPQSADTTHISKIITEIRENISTISEDLAKYSDELKISQEMESIFSDNGMKRLLMSQIIPLLNKKIQKTSKVLEFKYSFEFDIDFNPKITHLGIQIPPESLSVGEQKKINLIVLLGMLELIKLKHNNVNMLFLDEIFSSLDATSIIKVVDLLKAFSKKYNMTVFVISNDFLPKEYFDTWIQVENIDHFSDMVIS